MSRMILNSWGLDEVAATNQLERADPRSGRFDRFILGLQARLARHGSFFRGLPARRIARRVIALEQELARADDQELRQRVQRLRAGLATTGLSDTNVVEGFALVREVSDRLLGMHHFACQIMGGYAMLQGRIAEMMTGEGKTLTALLPAVVVALAGIPVHIVTVNLYLARRDSEELSPVYRFFGLSVGLADSHATACARVSAYACAVTYCVNKDLVFDYLRDRIQQRRLTSRAGPLIESWLGGGQYSRISGSLLRGLCFALVDEADSIFIDEAKTPLIISAEKEKSGERDMYQQVLALASALSEGMHYRIHPRERNVELTAAGREAIAAAADAFSGTLAIARAREELVERGLGALLLYELDRHYIVAEGKVQIVDEYTGRIMPDRSWEQGLHQLIEVKEGLQLTGQRQTIARITYQRFFRRYLRVGGMSGTVVEVSPELRKVFGLDVLRIPPNRPARRRNLGARVFASSDRRWDAVLESARSVASQGRAVLIGTRSVAASEVISQKLAEAGLEHRVLNARQDEQEANIIARAGTPGRITVATNMAGRGTDIKLDPAVRAAGGLHVILTEYHDSARIDRQLFGRAGRQGDRGSFEALVSIEDELFRSHAPGLAARLGKKLGREASLGGIMAYVLRRIAQRAAEDHHARIRQHTVETDDRLEKSLAFAGQGE